jgi:oligopeptide/dipeptide ABC transporter ATP-binding protein
MSIINIKNLYVEYESSNVFGNKQKIHAVNDVNLSINEGEIYSIAGESGCGKSSLLRAITGLIKPKSGKIEFNCNKKDIQMIFQTPALNPKMKIKDILIEPLTINRKKLTKTEKLEKIFEVTQLVGLLPTDLEKYPHEFSGGQKQRISIARALILEPKVLLADEPVSALDVSIQGQIINLLKDLKNKLNLTIIFISHDLNVIRYISDRVAIMYLGEIVEEGLTEEIYNNTQHPYAIALLAANPSCKNKQIKLKGELPSPIDLPSGCKFHTRCNKAFSDCSKKAPNNIKISDTHFVKCYIPV